jgi:hypothetical protein
VLPARLAVGIDGSQKNSPKIFSFFVEMQITNDYKFNVRVIEILHFSVTAFCRRETVSLGRDSFISYKA